MPLPYSPTAMQQTSDSSSIPLTSEQPPVFTSFLLFPKLPQEIRLEIFRLTFPRNRNIDLEKASRTPLPGERSIVELPLYRPITLHINKESRDETLLRYYIYTKSKLTSSPIEPEPCKRPLYFNPKIDMVHIRPAWDPYDSGMKALLEYLESRNGQSGLLEKVERLEIHDVRLTEKFKQRLLCPNQTSTSCCRWHILRAFTSLTHLTLVLESINRWFDSLNHALWVALDDAQDLVQLFQIFLENFKDRFPDGKAPKVGLRIKGLEKNERLDPWRMKRTIVE